MFGNYFYNERVRRCVGAFGSLFNDIYVLRKEKSGSVNSQQKVPLTFAPKRKFISMIERDAANALNKKDVIAITLPRMSFETVGLQYDPHANSPEHSLEFLHHRRILRISKRSTLRLHITFNSN